MPPPGNRPNYFPQKKLLKDVTLLIQSEMTFRIRPKSYSGLDTIVDRRNEQIGPLAYDLLRYIARATIL